MGVVVVAAAAVVVVVVGHHDADQYWVGNKAAGSASHAHVSNQAHPQARSEMTGANVKASSPRTQRATSDQPRHEHKQARDKPSSLGQS
jgi:hypothetical protein